MPPGTKKRNTFAALLALVFGGFVVQQTATDDQHTATVQVWYEGAKQIVNTHTDESYVNNKNVYPGAIHTEATGPYKGWKTQKVTVKYPEPIVNAGYVVFVVPEFLQVACAIDVDDKQVSHDQRAGEAHCHFGPPLTRA